MAVAALVCVVFPGLGKAKVIADLQLVMTEEFCSDGKTKTTVKTFYTKLVKIFRGSDFLSVNAMSSRLSPQAESEIRACLKKHFHFFATRYCIPCMYRK